MFQDEHNLNYRYGYKDPYQNEGNMLNYSNNKISQDNYYTNNYNNNEYSNYYPSINYNNNNFNISNDTYSQNSMLEKKEETNNSIYEKSKTIDSLSKRYFSKVTIDNIRQPKDFIYMLDNFLTENNYPKNYQINQEKHKISFIFYEESIAFNFTKYLNNIKNKNALYMEMDVHLSLTQNNKYNKDIDGKEIRKRGLSYDSIQRLFNGIGSTKHEKRRINTNLDPGIPSPFSYPYEKKRNKKMKDKNSNNNNNNSFMNEKLKDYVRLPIRVLDTKYKSLKPYEFRDEAKDKWISPSTFKC
jgi:hypothetical protein